VAQYVVAVVSEFGRTFRENGNKGTDHGHGSYGVSAAASTEDGSLASEKKKKTGLSGPTVSGPRLSRSHEYRAVLGGCRSALGALVPISTRVFPASMPVNLNLV